MENEKIEQILSKKYSYYKKLENGYYTVRSTTIFTTKCFFLDGKRFEEDEIGEWGLCDSAGKEIIKPQYLLPLIVTGNNYIVAKGIFNKDNEPMYKKAGIIDINNNEILQIKYATIDSLDEKGEKFIISFSKGRLFREKYGIIDIHNNIIIPLEYFFIEKIPTSVKSNNKFSEIEQIEVYNKDYKVGVYDIKLNKEIIPPKYEYLMILKRNMFLISDNDEFRMNGEIISIEE